MGKQIRIYLQDGSPSGVRHAEITNWSGQALACSRTRLSELKSWPEIQRPGVYFLFGLHDQTGGEAVYIGESEAVLGRLTEHMANKDFWTEFVAFTSKDENLTKAHVRYLESRLITAARSADRYRVYNSTSPPLPTLPRADRDAMDEFLDSVRMVLGVLGHRVVEPISVSFTNERTIDRLGISEGTAEAVSATSTLDERRASALFSLSVSGLTATAQRTAEGLVVMRGSQAAKAVRDSLSTGYQFIRRQLLETGTLVDEGDCLKFTRDHLFSSASQAAAVIVGYSINGRECWKLPDGTSFSAYEEGMSDRMLEELRAEARNDTEPGPST